jgi:hypothetical protein
MQGITESNLGQAQCFPQTAARYSALRVAENTAINFSMFLFPLIVIFV